MRGEGEGIIVRVDKIFYVCLQELDLRGLLTSQYNNVMSNEEHQDGYRNTSSMY